MKLFYHKLDAQNSCLFTYNTFIKLLYMFWALPGSSSGGLRHNCIYAVSGIVTVCRWLSCAKAQDSLLQRVTIPETAYIQLRRRPPEDEQGNARNMLSAGECLVPRHRTVTCREWRYQRLHIYNYDMDFLKMSKVMLETCSLQVSVLCQGTGQSSAESDDTRDCIYTITT